MTPPDDRTLPPEPDAAQDAQGAFVLAPPVVGLACAGALSDEPGAQLGLDGRSWAPLPREAPRSVPLHGLPDAGGQDDPDRPPERPTAGPPAQAVFDLVDVPQLGLWDRKRVAGALAQRPGQQTPKQQQRPGPHDRLSKCCHGVRVKADESPQLFRTDRGKLVWQGLMSCEEKCCPKCGVSWAHDTCNTLGAVFEAWLSADPQHDVWMLSLAIPHARTDDVRQLVRALYEMAPTFFRTSEWRAFARRFDIGQGKVVRIIDSTHGGDNGAHPHWHIALLVDGVTITGAERRDAAINHARAHLRAPDDDATDAERAAYAKAMKRADEDQARALNGYTTWNDAPLTALDRRERQIVLASLAARYGLWSAWVDTVRDWLGPERARFGRNRGELQPRHVARSALRLTPGEDASRYFTAWGLESEIGGTPIKARSHLRLLDAAGAGVVGAGDAWVTWREAMKRKSWAIGVTRACRATGVTAAMVEAYRKRKQDERDAARERAGQPVERVKPFWVVVPSLLWEAACLVGLDVIERIACEAVDAGAPAQDAVTRACWAVQPEVNRRALARARPPPEDTC